MRTEKLKSWEKVECVAGLLVKKQRNTSSVLLGLKLNGVVADLVMPLGGHIEEDDLGPITACAREISEEAGLNVGIGRRVAELRIRIIKPRLMIKVHVFLFTKFSGRLRNRTEEFGWLKFIKFSEIPWDKMPPCERDWMEGVLIDGKRRVVNICCGASRKDVRDIRVRPLKV